MTPSRDIHAGGPTQEDVDDRGDGDVTTPSKADVFIETGFTPEEYILRVIELNGRRLKQQTICDLTGWSEGAVSRTLSEMEEAGRITRLCIGREKVVFHPEEKSKLLASSDTDEKTR